MKVGALGEESGGGDIPSLYSVYALHAGTSHELR
jgi:hypothetical protein